MNTSAICPFFGYQRVPNQLLLEPGHEPGCGFVPPFSGCVLKLDGADPSIMDCPVVILDQNFGHIITSGFAIVPLVISDPPPAPPAAPEGK